MTETENERPESEYSWIDKFQIIYFNYQMKYAKSMAMTNMKEKSK